MARLPAALALLAAAAAAAAQPDQRPALREALALQEAVRAAIDEAEPAVAAVTVSRSDEYRRWQGAASRNPGELGGFDPGVLGRFPRNDRNLDALARLDLSNPSHVPEYYGSGVLIDARGLVLTNFHVVKDATKVYVRLPGGRGSYADIHAADGRSDLAVLRMQSVPPGLRPARIGDGSKVRRGDWVISLANPYSAAFRDGQPSASWGIVSNVRRRSPAGPRDDERHRALANYGTLIQTDARLTLGTSGGALVNLEGELIGLTTSLAAVTGGEQAGGYAVPTDAAVRRIVEVLRRGEEVEYGFLGVSVDEWPRPESVRVRSVSPGTPAELAGISTGDLIRSINGVPVRTVDELFLNLGTLLAGNRARVEVTEPSGRTRTAEVTLAKFHNAGPVIASNRPAPVRGVRVDYASVLAQAPPLQQDFRGGVLVREVVANSPAERAGLKAGADVVTHVNGNPVMTPADFYLEANRSGGPLELKLLDGDRTVTLPGGK